jgi:hypothetical protein
MVALSVVDRAALRRLLALRPEDTNITMLLHGAGEHRQLSFYVENSRNECRISFPETPDGH